MKGPVSRRCSKKSGANWRCKGLARERARWACSRPPGRACGRCRWVATERSAERLRVWGLCTLFVPAGIGFVSGDEIIAFVENEAPPKQGRNHRVPPWAADNHGPGDTSASPRSETTPSPAGLRKPVDFRQRLHAPPLKAEALDNIRSKLKSAAYTGPNGQQLDVLFGRFDKDGPGELEEEELRQALRRTLRFRPPSCPTMRSLACVPTLTVIAPGTSALVRFSHSLTASRKARRALWRVPWLRSSRPRVR